MKTKQFKPKEGHFVFVWAEKQYNEAEMYFGEIKEELSNNMYNVQLFYGDSLNLENKLYRKNIHINDIQEIEPFCYIGGQQEWIGIHNKRIDNDKVTLDSFTKLILNKKLIFPYTNKEYNIGEIKTVGEWSTILNISITKIISDVYEEKTNYFIEKHY